MVPLERIIAFESSQLAQKGEVRIDSPIKLITKNNLSDAGKYYKDE